MSSLDYTMSTLHMNANDRQTVPYIHMQLVIYISTVLEYDRVEVLYKLHSGAAILLMLRPSQDS